MFLGMRVFQIISAREARTRILRLSVRWRPEPLVFFLSFSEFCLIITSPNFKSPQKDLSSQKDNRYQCNTKAPVSNVRVRVWLECAFCIDNTQTAVRSKAYVNTGQHGSKTVYVLRGDGVMDNLGNHAVLFNLFRGWVVEDNLEAIPSLVDSDSTSWSFFE